MGNIFLRLAEPSREVDPENWQVYLFVSHAAPQTLEADVIDPAALAVHADVNAGVV
jgi:hypothetical protein